MNGDLARALALAEWVRAQDKKAAVDPLADFKRQMAAIRKAFKPKRLRFKPLPKAKSAT